MPWAPITLPLRPSLLGRTLSVGGSQAHSATALAPGSHLTPALLAPLRSLLALFAADTI